MKLCSKCKKEKSFDEFHKDSKSKDGLQHSCKFCRKIYADENKDKKSEWKKKHYKENKNIYKKYREDNKEMYNEYYKKYFKQRRLDDSFFKFSCNVRNSIKNSFKRGKNQFKKDAKTETILGCTIEEFILYIESKFIKGMTIENHGEWHLDHIIPLASANTKEEIIKLNHYTNFQPLWAIDNLSKGDKINNVQLKLI